MVGHAGSFQKGESRFECEREIDNFQSMRIAFSNCQLPRLPRLRKHGLVRHTVTSCKDTLFIYKSRRDGAKIRQSERESAIHISVAL